MRIQTNLLGARPVPARVVAPAVWLLAASMALASTWILREADELRDLRIDLEDRVSRMQEQKAGATGEAPLPSEAELDAMAMRVNALNAITETRGVDPTELLVWLERRMPDDVQLLRLRHRARGAETLLVAESTGTEGLAKLLRELEMEPRFAEALLAQQGTRSVRGKGSTIQFEIRIRHRT